MSTPSREPLPRQFYSAREIAELLGIPYESALDEIRRAMAHRRAGRHYLIPVAEYERYAADLIQPAGVRA